MPETQIGPVALRERIEVLDVLRGIAVCGILIGNMQWFSGYGMIPPELAAQRPLVDQVTHFLVHFLVEGKFYSIFSFLFGFGFALQIARAEERGDLKASVFKRRLFWLLVIGLLHGVVLWAGDILAIYALMGFVLLLFRRKSTESLLKWAVALMAVPVVWYILLYVLFTAFAPPDLSATFAKMQNEMWDRSNRLVANGGFVEILTDFNFEGFIGRYIGAILQMRLPKVLAMFLLGVYAYRRGFFQNLAGNRMYVRRVLVYGMLIGLAANLIFAFYARSEADIPPTPAGIVGIIAYAVGVPALALGTIALVATLWQRWRAALRVMAPVGRMALTNYLLQTVICVLIFYGYGFGFYGTFGPLTATLTALAIFVFQVLLSTLWLRFFAYGPVEWIWRQLTYRRRLPVVREHPAV